MKNHKLYLLLILLALIALIGVYARTTASQSATVICGPADGTAAWTACMGIGPPMDHTDAADANQQINRRVDRPTLRITAPPAYAAHRGRTMDRAWWLVTAASVAASVADVENTQVVLRAGGRETNPLMGARPSRLRAYGVTMAPTALFTYLSYRWKTQDDHDRATLGYTAKVRWWAPQVVNIGWHGVCIGITIALTRR